METFDEEAIKTLADELKMMSQSDADELLGRINCEILGDLCPYSEGDDLIDIHADLISQAEELIERYNA